MEVLLYFILHDIQEKESGNGGDRNEFYISNARAPAFALAHPVMDANWDAFFAARPVATIQIVERDSTALCRKRRSMAADLGKCQIIQRKNWEKITGMGPDFYCSQSKSFN